MTPQLRCVIFAAVSSKPQAAEDKDSIPTQIARARALIERREWAEEHDPLVVPGHTRSISWLHEAHDEVPAIAALIDLAQSGSIDLVVCRDYDRLARKRSLLAQISEYLRQRRVQIYALDKPVEPSDPSELRRNEGGQSAALIEAISGVTSEEEVRRIVRRRTFGMNAVMRRGNFKLPERSIPYGYTRIVEDDEGADVRLDAPVQVPEQVAIIRWIEDLYLGGHSYARIASLLNAEGVPSPRGSVWQRSTLRGILRNEFYCGLLMWGYRRRESVFDPDSGGFVKKDVYASVVSGLLEKTGYLPTAFDLIDYPEECKRDQLVIVEGEHKPIRTKQRQRAIYDEMEQRREMGGRAASTTGFCYLFSGIIRCGDCGHSMAGRHKSSSPHAYYYCVGARHGVPCDNRHYIRESVLYEKVMSIMRQIASEPTVADAYLERGESANRDALMAERDVLQTALRELEARRGRWDDAYETKAIELEKYRERVALLTEERDTLVHRFGQVEKALSKSNKSAQRREQLLELLEEMPPVEDRQRTKVFLRNAIKELVVTDGDLVQIVL